MSSNHRVDTSFFGDPGDGAAGPQRSTALRGATADAFSKLDAFGGHNQSVKYSGAIGSGFWSRRAGRAPAMKYRRVPSPTRTPSPTPGQCQRVAVAVLGSSIEQQLRHIDTQAKATHLIANHQIRRPAC